MFFNKSLVSIDIGSSAVKMLELSGKGELRKLRNFAMEALPQGTIENGNVMDPGAITSCVKKLVSRLGVKGRFAALSVAGGGVILKRVRISAGRDATVTEQINFHAAQAFQLDLAELYYDFVEMGPVSAASDEVDVLLVGARREVVEQYVSIVKDAGIQLAVIEASAISVANMFELNYGVVEGLVALISIGASNTQVSFIDRGRMLYSHTIPVGGDVYTNSIVQAMTVPRATAEELKISGSTNPAGMPPDLVRVMNETNALIVSDIRQIFNFFSTSSDADGAGPVKFAFLTGGGSCSVGLDAAIAAAIGVPVNLANPFQRVEVADGKFRLDQVMALSPMFGVAVGLGVREKGDKVAA
jgi:type IV pilus assembly protein PilM